MTSMQLITMVGHLYIVQRRVTTKISQNFSLNMVHRYLLEHFVIEKLRQKNVKMKIQRCVSNIFEVNVKWNFQRKLSAFFFSEVENRLGVTNEGLVYALFDYESEGKSVDDELKFIRGEKLRIRRRNDENENEWWWAKRDLNDDEGFVPRNFLGVRQKYLCLFSSLNFVFHRYFLDFHVRRTKNFRFGFFYFNENKFLIEIFSCSMFKRIIGRFC